MGVQKWVVQDQIYDYIHGVNAQMHYPCLQEWGLLIG